MGRRRRKTIKIVKKRIPRVFLCPYCGQQSVRVTIRSPGWAIVACGNCELKSEIEGPPGLREVDFYCRFADRFYEKAI